MFIRITGLFLILSRALYRCAYTLISYKVENTSSLKSHQKAKVVIFGPECLVRMKEGFYFTAETINRSQVIAIDNGSRVPSITPSLVKTYLRLISISFSAKSSMLIKNRFDRIVLCISHILCFDAFRNIILIDELESFIEAMSPQIILCFHEMHPYSRIVWSVANKKDIKTLAIQHAHIDKNRGLLRVNGLNLKLLPSKLLLWNKSALNTATQLGWPNSHISLSASERYQPLSSASTHDYIQPCNEYNLDVAVLMPSLLKQEFYTCVLAGIALLNLYPKLKVYIKPHPNFKLSRRDVNICIKHRITMITKSSRIKSNPSRNNLAITCSSTAPMEYVDLGFIPIYIPIHHKSNLRSNPQILQDITRIIAASVYRGISQPKSDASEYFGTCNATLAERLDHEL